MEGKPGTGLARRGLRRCKGTGGGLACPAQPTPAGSWHEALQEGGAHLQELGPSFPRYHFPKLVTALEHPVRSSVLGSPMKVRIKVKNLPAGPGGTLL